MGTVYRRQVRFCTTCDRRLDTTAARHACAAAGHAIEIREQSRWWIKYQVGGRPQCVTFEDATADLVHDYTTNRRRSLRVVTLRLAKHLTPFFERRRLMTITTADARAFTARRQAAGASNATINRDLMLLKRMGTLAMQAGKLTVRPYIPLLKESHIRTGFFEPAQFTSVTHHLPVHLQPIVAFAYITGWRTPSEILPLEWRQVDLTAGEVRLDPGTTKNDDGRGFPLTRELRRVLDAQHAVAERLTREQGLIARYVFCYPTGQKTGQRITESGFNKAWRKARVAAGCPGRIPHDFRRTAVRTLVRAGVPERVAMQLTGHKTRAVFERYNIVSSGDLRDAARRLDTYASGV
jgi:integrase